MTTFESQSQIHGTATFEDYVQIAKKITDDECTALKFGGCLLQEVRDKDLEIQKLQFEAKLNLIELTSCKTRLLEALGILNLRGAWECYERERSKKKMRNPFIGRKEVWEELVATKKFDHCFQFQPISLSGSWVHMPSLTLSCTRLISTW